MKDRQPARPPRRAGTAVPLSAALAALLAGLAAAEARAGDPVAGERVFRQCVACHSVEPGQNKVGPYLFGVVGRQAGSVERFRYSRAMRAADIVWDEENLAAYLKDPRGFLPGTSMAIRLRNPDDAPDLIAFLKSLTEEPGTAE